MIGCQTLAHLVAADIIARGWWLVIPVSAVVPIVLWRVHQLGDALHADPAPALAVASLVVIAAGADVYVVQTMLGHAKPSMTLEVYGHLWPDRLDEVADAMDVGRIKAKTKQMKQGANA